MSTTFNIELINPEPWSTPTEQARLWAPKLKALADEKRLVVALLLAEAPRTVKELQQATGLGQTLVSHHLGLLREQGLVSLVPKGRSNVYTLCCEEIAGVVRALATVAASTSEGAEACCSDRGAGTPL